MIAAVAPPRAADSLLENEIATRLAATRRPSLQRLSIDVLAGQVTLRGSVGSFHEKQLAIGACRVLSGIEQLIDAVEVAEH
jgi:osmotically-inducible protein OsmY